MHLNLHFTHTHLPYPLWHIDPTPHLPLMLPYEPLDILLLAQLPLILALHLPHLLTHPLDFKRQSLFLEGCRLYRVIAEDLCVVVFQRRGI